MTERLGDVFSDTSYWIAVIIEEDVHNAAARLWSTRIFGRIITTVPVLLEVTNALSRQRFRTSSVDLLERIQSRPGFEIIELTSDLWMRGQKLYRERMDKDWSLTDCISFLVMEERGLTAALTSDKHFEQAGLRALLLDTE